MSPVERDPTGRAADWPRRLAAAIVTQALRDAAAPARRDPWERRRWARAWLDATDADFRFWAAVLGQDPARLARQIWAIVERDQVAAVLTVAARPSPLPPDDEADDDDEG